VQRHDCPEDRRVRYVELTAKGERLMEALFPRHAKVITAALAGLSATEQQEATRLLKQLGKYAADARREAGTD
jgi:MarR family 2-MHQ and catechol resistance regulon transcriptional repressor